MSAEIDRFLDLRNFVEDAMDYDPFVMHENIMNELDRILKEVTGGEGK